MTYLLFIYIFHVSEVKKFLYFFLLLFDFGFFILDFSEINSRLFCLYFFFSSKIEICSFFEWLRQVFWSQKKAKKRKKGKKSITFRFIRLLLKLCTLKYQSSSGLSNSQHNKTSPTPTLREKKWSSDCRKVVSKL